MNGQNAYWTTGPHVIQLLTSEGVVHARVEGNVLLWTDGVYTMRLETALPKPRPSGSRRPREPRSARGVAGASDHEEGSR